MKATIMNIIVLTALIVGVFAAVRYYMADIMLAGAVLTGTAILFGGLAIAFRALWNATTPKRAPQSQEWARRPR